MAAETVAYVASRSTALASLLGLASLRLAVGCLEGAPRPLRMTGALGCFVLALATKEEAVAIPLLLLLLDYFFVAGQRARVLVWRSRVHVPFLALPILGLLARRVVTGAWLPPAALDPARYVATQIAAFSGYFLRALFPIDPAFYRGQPASSWPPDAPTLLGWAATSLLLAAAFYGRRRWPDWSLAVAWLVAALLPSSSLVALKEMVVDHRAYLGSAGVQFAVGTLLARAPNAWPAISLVALLGLRAAQYDRVLADPVRAWQDAVRRAPGASEARLGLGEAYAARGDPRAEEELLHAVELDRGNPMAWTNLGAFFVEKGRLPEAAQAMRSAAEQAPRDARIRDNLGLILESLGREDEAMAEYEAAAAGWPPLVQPRVRLADLLIRRGERQRAAALLKEAASLELDEEDARAIEALWARIR
jgi:tetratricopeptide (TPR) repeat protein